MTSLYSLILYFVPVFLWLCNSIIPISPPFIHDELIPAQVNHQASSTDEVIVCHEFRCHYPTPPTNNKHETPPTNNRHETRADYLV